MALDQSALLEVLDALTAAEVDDRIRQAAQTIYQALIEAELTAVIGAALHQRTEARLTQRNGRRPRVLTTSAGDLELRIPKLRAGSFLPSLLERRRRVDQALFAVVMEAYLHGVSTRKVDDLVRALGADSGISKSEVSRICAGLDGDVAAFRDRSLAGQSFPYPCSCCIQQGQHPVQPDPTACRSLHTRGMRRGSQPRSTTTTDTPGYLRTAEVAAILHVSPKTVSRWAKEGKLPFLKTLGGHRRYPAAKIRRLADELQVQPTT